MRYDIVLLHPPSIYDFRKRDVVAGPISELVPSTGVFEMYPIGFLAMLSYLNSRGLKARIDNVALKMLNSRRYDFKEEILKMDTEYVGIDLHWLPHVHGAISIARIVKEIRPDIKVMFGGFSSTYYSSELMSEIRDIDVLVKGDATEIPMSMVLEGKKKEDIPNIIYREGEKIKDNGFSFVPDLDYQTYDYLQIVKSSIKSMDVIGHMPYCDWAKEPVAMALSVHGCSFGCIICGGSHFAFKNFYRRVGPIYRSGEKLVQDIMNVNNDLKIPVFVVGDILMRPQRERDYIFKTLRKEGLDIPLLFEVFYPHPREELEDLVRVTHDVSMEISPDTSNDQIRFKNGRPYKNRELEAFISDFLTLGGKKMDVYFIVGLSGQTREDVLNDVKYSEKLMKMNNNDSRLFTFTSPLSPFLDPGSMAFETPSLGYKLRFRKVMEHYNALDTGKTWEDFLNYETQWMDRHTLVDTTYLAIDELLKVKEKLGYISSEEYENSHDIIESSKLAVQLSRVGDYGMMEKGDVLIRSCSGKYTILKKQIMWGSGNKGERSLIFMIYRYLHSSRK
ncbi:MAG: TIGR04190 family B12-binding domain/radical SAM domain protein [Thermoplasmatales archaeon]